MSTVMKDKIGTMPSTPTTTPNKDQLRRDRRTAIIVLAIMVAMMGLVVWLASMSGAGIPEGVDYWPMVP